MGMCAEGSFRFLQLRRNHRVSKALKKTGANAQDAPSKNETPDGLNCFWEKQMLKKWVRIIALVLAVVQRPRA